jgi:hypothetical protein
MTGAFMQVRWLINSPVCHRVLADTDTTCAVGWDVQESGAYDAFETTLQILRWVSYRVDVGRG